MLDPRVYRAAFVPAAFALIVAAFSLQEPPSGSGSSREPVSTQMPTATERTCGIVSVTRRMPLGSALFRYATKRGSRSGRS